MGVHRYIIFNIFVLAILLNRAYGKSESGKTETVLNPNYSVAREQHPMLENTRIYVKLLCDEGKDVKLTIFWTLTERECYNDILYPIQNISNEKVIVSPELSTDCHHMIYLPQLDRLSSEGDITSSPTTFQNFDKEDSLNSKRNTQSPNYRPIATVAHDGIYEITLTIKAQDSSEQFTATAIFDIIGPHGYISATDWPLLPFFGIMCFVYVVFGIIWLVVSFMQWRDLLRIQFWIGGVILLGMLEKAFFYAEYHSQSKTGVPVQGAEIAAEFVSCAKRTLARMLVIIMSLGFGIVKPRLGPMLHRVVGVGALYFVLACVESYLRVMNTKSDDRNKLLVASIPLAVLDTGICWWIFTSLVQTTRTLRLRRNMVKLSLYRHFTNTLIFSVIVSVIFMLSAMRLRKAEYCTPGWREIWIDTAFWHVLFSVLLLVIMILWRPTNNNQRYAFTPLLDNPEDEDDDEEDQFVSDAYGVKMRGTIGPKTPLASNRATTTEEDDLRWVEENIPTSMTDSALPVLDSDEEIINTKFEVSKMQ